MFLQNIQALWGFSFLACNGPNDFQCANGYCIAEDENYCNGFDGCGDNSDEPLGCGILQKQTTFRINSSEGVIFM